VVTAEHDEVDPNPDRGELVHYVLSEIPETHRPVVAALLELPVDYDVAYGITVNDLVMALVTKRIEPEPVWRALVALDLVRPGLGDAP
jgi:hypothetical protein